MGWGALREHRGIVRDGDIAGHRRFSRPSGTWARCSRGGGRVVEERELVSRTAEAASRNRKAARLKCH